MVAELSPTNHLPSSFCLPLPSSILQWGRKDVTSRDSWSTETVTLLHLSHSKPCPGTPVSPSFSPNPSITSILYPYHQRLPSRHLGSNQRQIP
uniref:Uncharacterized protein n=1 Tax=Rhizophora mucronata TaxID=61149 RepID=A0A2P2KSQ3_RHIMU